MTGSEVVIKEEVAKQLNYDKSTENFEVNIVESEIEHNNQGQRTASSMCFICLTCSICR